MTNSKYPLTYNDDQELQSREKLTSALKGKIQAFIRAISLIARESNLISFDQYSFTVKQMTSSLS